MQWWAVEGQAGESAAGHWMAPSSSVQDALGGHAVAGGHDCGGHAGAGGHDSGGQMEEF